MLAFFKFLHKKVSRLDKKASAHFCIILGFVIWNNHVAKPPDLFNECRKNIFCHFLANVMVKQPRVRAYRASPGQKWPDLRVACSKNFSRATFFVFWSTQMVDICLSYLPVKQIWWKSAVWDWAAPDQMTIPLKKLPWERGFWVWRVSDSSLGSSAHFALDPVYSWYITHLYVHYEKKFTKNIRPTDL